LSVNPQNRPVPFSLIFANLMCSPVQSCIDCTGNASLACQDASQGKCDAPESWVSQAFNLLPLLKMLVKKVGAYMPTFVFYRTQLVYAKSVLCPNPSHRLLSSCTIHHILSNCTHQHQTSNTDAYTRLRSYTPKHTCKPAGARVWGRLYM